MDSTETTGLLSRLGHVPTTLVIENRTSEPRDALASERTTLSWIRFAATLALSSVAIMLNYRFETDSADGGDGDNGRSGHGFTKNKGYILAVGICFALLALSSIVLGGYNYFQTLNHCVSQKIHIFNPKPTLYLLTTIVAVMLGVSISLIVDQL